MALITSIETQKHDSERVSIYLDGSFGFGATVMLAAARGLVPGRELSEEDVERLVHDDEIERVYGASLNFLSYRPRSRREIEDHFRRKGIDGDVVAAVIERLERSGLVDDRKFAAFWVENRQNFSPRGMRALRSELRAKGVETEVVDEALEHIEDEEPAALEVAGKRVHALRHADDRTFSTRMVQHLQRRGFSYRVAASVTRQLLLERSGEPSADEDLHDDIR